MKSKISLTRSKDSYQGTFAALRLLEDQLRPLMAKAKKPVIKVNFVTARRKLAATPVEAVGATIDFMRQYCEAKILVAETATLGTTEEAWRNYGYHRLKKIGGVELFDLEDDKTFPLDFLDRKANPFAVPFSTTLRDSDLLVSLTRPKTHDTVVLTLTGKNIAVGGIIGQRGRVHQGKMIHENLLRALEKVPPHLAVLDGTLGMEGDGPCFGDPIKAGWAAASLDWLAMDTLGVYLMGDELENIGYLYLAKEKKMGKTFPREVEIIGENPQLLRRKFRPHPSYFSQIRWRE